MPDKEQHEIQLDPTPGFVIKTLLAESELKSRKPGTKVFINVCWDRRVPEPTIPSQQDWTIPVIVSASEQTCLDKAGRSSLVWDCCINLNVLQAALESTEVRAHLIETCLGVVEDAFHIQLSRDHIAIPKLRQKGELQKTLITSSMLDQFVSSSDDKKDEEQQQQRPLITEVGTKNMQTHHSPVPPKPSQDDSSSDLDLKPVSTVRYSNRKEPEFSYQTPKDTHITKLGPTANYSYRVDITFEKGSSCTLKVEADDDDDANNLYIYDRQSNSQLCQPIRIPPDATPLNRKNLPIRALYVTPESSLSIFI